MYDLQLVLKNESRRMAAEGLSVRIVEMLPHPIVFSVGPKYGIEVVALDQLLPRISGETTFALPPRPTAPLPITSSNPIDTSPH